MTNLNKSRREMIAVGVLSTMSGCLDGSLLSSESEDSVSLGGIFVRDHREEIDTYQIQLERDSEIVYQGELTIDSAYEFIESTWSSEPATYELIWATDEEMGSVSIPTDVREEMDEGDCFHPEILHRGHYGPVVDMHLTEDVDEGAC
ncbi:hypothetical protein [Natronoglomus mannanivorans]|uniref:Uncharacterized protein n=1 Tax=Natronoglomus mannanivorans TaxID=2979990 RepID=A0AAP2Z4E6_9EURY|nr:hypothetical protein [Halobacteria archaeon AArc-xg1-1]